MPVMWQESSLVFLGCKEQKHGSAFVLLSA